MSDILKYPQVGKKWDKNLDNMTSLAWIDPNGFVHWLKNDHFYFADDFLINQGYHDPEENEWWTENQASYELMQLGWLKPATFSDFAFHINAFDDQEYAFESMMKLAVEGALTHNIDPFDPIYTVIEVSSYNFDIGGPNSKRYTYSLDELLNKWGSQELIDFYYSQKLKKNPSSLADSIIALLETRDIEYARQAEILMSGDEELQEDIADWIFEKRKRSLDLIGDFIKEPLEGIPAFYSRLTWTKWMAYGSNPLNVYFTIRTATNEFHIEFTINFNRTEISLYDFKSTGNREGYEEDWSFPRKKFKSDLSGIIDLSDFIYTEITEYMDW